MSQGVIQGAMREAPLPDIIQLVSQGGKSGCFHVQQDAARVKIHLKDGRIVHAVSSSGREGIDAFMEVALWLDGSYRFEEGPQEVQPTITKPITALLVDFGTRLNEWKVISQKIPSVELYAYSTLLPGETPTGVNPRQARLFPLITGYYSVAELAEVMGKPLLQVGKDLYDLVMHGHVVLKGVRSNRPPQLPPDMAAKAAPAPAPAPAAPAPAPAPMAEEPSILPPPPAQPYQPGRISEETAIVKLMPPRPVAQQGFPLAEEPPLVTVGGYVPEPPKPAAAPMSDPVKMAKLTAFTQRIAKTAKTVLPEAQHEMVDRLHARATQQLLGGDGAEAVKGLALSISRGAVDAGCDAELVRNLNAQLKALFGSK